MLGFVDQSSHVFFTMIGWIMKLAPLGAFGAMAYIIGQYGISSLGSYGKLIACCYLAAVLLILVLGVINFETEADNVHTSTNTNNPNTTSAKGYWRNINCPSTYVANVSVQLQSEILEGSGGNYQNVGAAKVDYNVPALRNKGDKTIARYECPADQPDRRYLWRSEVDVDIVGHADTADRKYSNIADLPCRPDFLGPAT